MFPECGSVVNVAFCLTGLFKSLHVKQKADSSALPCVGPVAPAVEGGAELARAANQWNNFLNIFSEKNASLKQCCATAMGRERNVAEAAKSLNTARQRRQSSLIVVVSDGRPPGWKRPRYRSCTNWLYQTLTDIFFLLLDMQRQRPERAENSRYDFVARRPFNDDGDDDEKVDKTDVRWLR